MNNILDLELKLDAGVLLFSPFMICEDDGVFDFNVSCIFDGKFSGFLPGNFFCRLHRNDIERLIAYFDCHINLLMVGEWCESTSYVPLESDLQIKALDGDVIDCSDGEFSINILFNCGKGAKGTTNTYFGFETVVEISDLSKFCHGLESF